MVASLAAGARAGLADDGFIGQVKANFSSWDLDHDGVLSVDEIEKALDDPAVKGPSAAAVASLRQAVYAQPAIKPITLEKLIDAVDDKGTINPKPPAYRGMYAAALKKIETRHREVFVSETPRVETLGQGRLGDCFLLAPLGTVAYCQPKQLVDMLQPKPDGTIAVHFGDGETVALPAPTDGEIVIGASTLDDGRMCSKNRSGRFICSGKPPRATQRLLPSSVWGERPTHLCRFSPGTNAFGSAARIFKRPANWTRRRVLPG
jgi:hypothetical protein